jgi:hypothetical protein
LGSSSFAAVLFLLHRWHFAGEAETSAMYAKPIPVICRRNGPASAPRLAYAESRWDCPLPSLGWEMVLENDRRDGTAFDGCRRNGPSPFYGWETGGPALPESTVEDARM